MQHMEAKRGEGEQNTKWQWKISHLKLIGNCQLPCENYNDDHQPTISIIMMIINQNDPIKTSIHRELSITMFGYQRVPNRMCRNTDKPTPSWQRPMPQPPCQQLRHLLSKPTDTGGVMQNPMGWWWKLRKTPAKSILFALIFGQTSWLESSSWSKMCQSPWLYGAGLILIHNHQATAMLMRYENGKKRKHPSG